LRSCQLSVAELPALAEHAIDECSFAVIDVSDDGNVSEIISDFGHFVNYTQDGRGVTPRLEHVARTANARLLSTTFSGVKTLSTPSDVALLIIRDTFSITSLALAIHFFVGIFRVDVAL